MKIKVDKTAFIKSWSLTERSAGSPNTMNIFSAIRVRTDEAGMEMQAVDMKTSITCKAVGVTVLEPGEAVIPIKGVSDLFKKAGSDEFTLQIDGGKAVMVAGKSRYRFATFSVSEFPKLPSSSGAAVFCTISASVLSHTLDRGALCASVSEEWPQYLSSPCFEVDPNGISVISTDNRRLALCRGEVTTVGEGKPLLLPMKGLKELERILGMLNPETEIRVLYDDAQVYFACDEMEFSIRRVESKFPNYAKILPKGHTTRVDMDRAQLLSAVERVDVVVRDSTNRAVTMKIVPGEGCTLSGRAPEFGEAVEDIACEATGEPVRVGFNTRFFMDAVKALDGEMASLFFNGSEGHMCVRERDSDSFLCLVAPVELSGEEVELPEQMDSGGDAL